MEEHTEEIHADEGVLDIMTDPAHLVGELAFEGIFFLLSALWLRYKLRRRDKAHHHVEPEDDKVPMW